MLYKKLTSSHSHPMQSTLVQNLKSVFQTLSLISKKISDTLDTDYSNFEFQNFRHAIDLCGETRIKQHHLNGNEAT